MVFNSLQFLIFFPVVLILFYILPYKLKKFWLLFASYFFYMCWNAKYALLLFSSTLITYLSGIFIDRFRDDVSKKKLVVALSFITNLGVLFFFKYYNFTAATIEGLFGTFKIALEIPRADIILPVGISFYTFQALSYTMDVYRGDIYSEKDFFTYALYVSFFPQLVAGPIERSKNLLRQLNLFMKFDLKRALDGAMVMMWGYFLKTVCADRIAVFVDAVYSDLATYKGMYVIIATVLFAVQIYCDFAGYSTIAVGAARILGIEIMENFNAPYLSTTTGEFWRRWHISLTSWFKDYLYIPLGGSRKGTLRKYINKMIVFLVSGLWHGAELSFVLWGGLNGLYQVAGEALMPLRDRLVRLFSLNRNSIGHRIAAMLVTFVLVDFAWIFFRAQTIAEAFTAIKSIFTVYNPWILFDGSLYELGMGAREFWFMIICILLLLWADIQKKKGIVIRNVIMKQDAWCRVLVLSLGLAAILIFGIWGTGYDATSFIYFQF